VLATTTMDGVAAKVSLNGREPDRLEEVRIRLSNRANRGFAGSAFPAALLAGRDAGTAHHVECSHQPQRFQ